MVKMKCNYGKKSYYRSLPLFCKLTLNSNAVAGPAMHLSMEQSDVTLSEAEYLLRVKLVHPLCPSE